MTSVYEVVALIMTLNLLSFGNGPALLTLLGSIWTVFGKTIGARLMANEPRPNVEASIRSGSGVAAGFAAVKLWEPLAVALAESVIVLVELETARIVVPAGMQVPVTVSPATRPAMLLMPVTEADPLVSVPVKT